MAVCGADCAEGGCYTSVKPLTWSRELNRAARFHSDNMSASGCSMKHNSPCALVANIDVLYPGSCDGATDCACQPGTEDCGVAGGTDPWARIALFGSTGYGENIASSNPDPTVTFYLWLFEVTSDESCGSHASFDNTHRFNILREEPYINSLGSGIGGSYATTNFGVGPAAGKIPSGSHFPRQAASVELWTNWYDAEGPNASAANINGVCHPMSLERGSATNGAWMVTANGVGSGCHRYYFEFQDSAGTLVTYPTTGSLAIGSGVGCPDWDAARPNSCLVQTGAVFSDGFETGNTDQWSATIP